MNGHARKMIPKTMEDIDEAFRILREIYGDPSRVMSFKRNKILSLGNYPRNSSNPKHIRDQVEYLMKLEINLEGMFELGKVSKKMEHVAFSPDLITTICDLFPTTIQDELTECEDDDPKVEHFSPHNHIEAMITQNSFICIGIVSSANHSGKALDQYSQPK